MVFKLWFYDQEVLLEVCYQSRNTMLTSPPHPVLRVPMPPVPTENRQIWSIGHRFGVEKRLGKKV